MDDWLEVKLIEPKRIDTFFQGTFAVFVLSICYETDFFNFAKQGFLVELLQLGKFHCNLDFNTYVNHHINTHNKNKCFSFFHSIALHMGQYLFVLSTPFRSLGVENSFKTFTQPKTKGWNPKSNPFRRKVIFQTGIFSFQPVTFSGVSCISMISTWKLLKDSFINTILQLALLGAQHLPSLGGVDYLADLLVGGDPWLRPSTEAISPNNTQHASAKPSKSVEEFYVCVNFLETKCEFFLNQW